MEIVKGFDDTEHRAKQANERRVIAECGEHGQPLLPKQQQVALAQLGIATTQQDKGVKPFKNHPQCHDAEPEQYLQNKITATEKQLQ